MEMSRERLCDRTEYGETATAMTKKRASIRESQILKLEELVR